MAEQRSTKVATPEDLSKQLEQLRSDVSELTKTVGELSRGQVTELRSRAEQRAAELRARGRETAEHAMARARDAEQQAEDYIRERPLQSLAFAAALGVVIGFLTRPR